MYLLYAGILSVVNTEEFKRLLRVRGEELYRAMPWREDTRPYYVLVSELMLQQTQVSRVIPKFEEFIAEFPDERALGRASLANVVTKWQGLGYNRRAKYLHEAAKAIASEYDGVFPTEAADILRLPGVGKNTLGAIEAYAFNRPSIFVETNIRTVYIHHFFNDQFDIDDKRIIGLLKETIDHDNPRRFYQNLMDYGSWLKANGVRNVSSSKHYKKQSPLEGSVRQVRGQIIRALTRQDQTESELRHKLVADERFSKALNGLASDGLITISNGVIHLTK